MRQNIRNVHDLAGNERHRHIGASGRVALRDGHNVHDVRTVDGAMHPRVTNVVNLLHTVSRQATRRHGAAYVTARVEINARRSRYRVGVRRRVRYDSQDGYRVCRAIFQDHLRDGAVTYRHVKVDQPYKGTRTRACQVDHLDKRFRRMLGVAIPQGVKALLRVRPKVGAYLVHGRLIDRRHTATIAFNVRVAIRQHSRSHSVD